jgi:hypothetical protein
LTVQVGPHLGAGGATTFVFNQGEVFGWRMSIQGSAERLLDSVLPHEITHMVFASHFRQPLPRWADEGGATSVEHASERNKHRHMLDRYLRTGYGIAFNQMFAMTEYPHDPNELMALYSQGYSVAEYLIQIGGRRKYVAFLGDGLKSDDWSGAVEKHYGIRDLGTLQNTWLAWVSQGSPLTNPPQQGGGALASAERRARPEPNLVYHEPDKRPEANLALVPVHIPETGRSGAAAVAANVPHRPPQTLPASGWHAPGAATGSVASSSPQPGANRYREQVSHPQPVERPQ